jgi:hypothetical protein
MGEDRQALMIYVFKMQDYDKAEEYVVPAILLFPPMSDIGDLDTAIAFTYPKRYKGRRPQGR